MTYSLLFFVHIKNYMRGKTTNERFSRKAHSSFSETGDNTSYLDRTESESLMDNGGNNSIVEDEEKPGRKSTRKDQVRNSMRRVKKTCM
jgi:hypothetical protein